MGYGYIVFITDPLYVFNNLFDHVLIVECKRERSFDGKSSTNVDRIKGVTDFPEFTIFKDEATEFTPIVRGVFNPCVDEKMQHFQLCFRTRCNLFFVQGHNVAVADAKPRSIKFKFRLFI